ncbi:MAG: head GIN domain-containing protein [Cytophagales bacterium]|nr:head GIN domain-containing protein [Cytophagales bacterium]
MKKLVAYSICLFFCLTAVIAQDRDTRKLKSFSSISVGEAIDVEVKAGNEEKAIVEVDGTSPDNVLTEVFGSRLKIRMRQGNWRNVSVRVYVTYKELEEIDVSSAADLSSDGPIKSESLEIEVSSAGDVEVEVDVEELEVRVSSAGDLTIEGKAIKQYVRVSSSGDYDGYDLESEEAEVDASSSGDARVFVTKELEADASSSGSVYYRGNPTKVYADSSSGGRVRKS